MFIQIADRAPEYIRQFCLLICLAREALQAFIVSTINGNSAEVSDSSGAVDVAICSPNKRDVMPS